MKLLISIIGSSRYNPFIRLAGGSGRFYTFGWNDEFKAHIWSRGIISQQDSADLEDIFATKDPFYRPSIKIIKDEEKPVAIDEAPAPKAKRPRKAVAV